MRVIVTLLVVAVSLAAVSAGQTRGLGHLKKDFREGYDPEGKNIEEPLLIRCRLVRLQVIT